MSLLSISDGTKVKCNVLPWIACGDKHLPLAQVLISGSWDPAPTSDPAQQESAIPSPSLSPSVPLCPSPLLILSVSFKKKKS